MHLAFRSQGDFLTWDVGNFRPPIYAGFCLSDHGDHWARDARVAQRASRNTLLNAQIHFPSVILSDRTGP